ncbi:MAG: pyridoxamine 5'-phosphate oxidase family protein [Patescibacteria group bacterium]|nr:pyridoxamine 5'-phosphate oxidase family protein [Patescibacteria group bacterium]
MEDSDKKKLILNFIKSQKLAVLATVNQKSGPEAAVIEFGQTDDLEIIFDTLTSYRKYKNLSENSKVAIVVGWDNDVTIQYEGEAVELAGEEKIKCQELYFEKNPEARRWSDNPEIKYYKVIPKWIRYSDLNVKPWNIIELNF